MLKTFRARLISSTIIAITTVVFGITFTINLLNGIWLRSHADDMLRIISDFNGNMPVNTDEIENRVNFNVDNELPFRTRFFVIKTDPNGHITETMTSNIASVSNDNIDRYNQATIGLKDNTYGSFEEYRYLVRVTDHGRMVTFLDRSQDKETIRLLFVASTLTALIGLSIMFAIIILSSNQIIKPFVQNQEKQKQFITDAGHELKTPLAIIRTNAEVLEVCNGQNEWIDSIKNQTERLDGLIKGLLSLAKSGEVEDEVPVRFSLSATVNEVAQPFKTLAEQKGHKMHFDITPSIDYTGSPQSISTLVSILVDNAIKYASDGGEVLISLSRISKGALKTAKLIVENDTDIPPTEDPSRFFERFYRSDNSRARETGGYGIGLSVAQTIVEQHKGKITADRVGNRIVFTVIL